MSIEDVENQRVRVWYDLEVFSIDKLDVLSKSAFTSWDSGMPDTPSFVLIDSQK